MHAEMLHARAASLNAPETIGSALISALVVAIAQCETGPRRKREAGGWSGEPESAPYRHVPATSYASLTLISASE